MAKVQKKNNWVKPVVWGVGVGGVILVGWWFLSQKEKSPPPPPPPPTPTPTPTTKPAPDFSSWKDVAWPLAAPITNTTSANTAFVIRLVQQRLMDTGFLTITQTTGNFGTQTAEALVQYKIKKLGIAAGTPDMEKIGVATMKGLFPSYEVYKGVYDKLKAFYASKNEVIPIPLSGLDRAFTIITKSNVEAKIFDKKGEVVDTVKEGNIRLGFVVGEYEGWIVFETNNGLKRAIEKKFVRYE